jgi:carbon storage regulator
MLVLSRKIGERIYIGSDIVLTVLDVRGRQVRLGLEAPEAVLIRREELLSAKGEGVRDGIRESQARAVKPRPFVCHPRRKVSAACDLPG